MLTYFWIGLGSTLGGMARYCCSGVIARTFGETFPWGTIIVNASGSLIIGFLAPLRSPDGRLLVPHDARVILTLGLCGGYRSSDGDAKNRYFTALVCR